MANKYCGEECTLMSHDICDFCTNYIDQSEAEGTTDYAGVGFCKAKNKRVRSIDGCDDCFNCMYVENKKPVFDWEDEG